MVMAARESDQQQQQEGEEAQAQELHLCAAEAALDSVAPHTNHKARYRQRSYTCRKAVRRTGICVALALLVEPM